MAQIKHFPLPDVGEGLTEAEILRWHVAPGDSVTVNQIIVEIETAKAAVELPCPFAGVVTELFADPGATVQVGAPLIGIETASADTGSQESQEQGRTPNLVGYGPRTGAVTRRARRRVPDRPPPPPAPPAPVSAPAAAETTAVPQPATVPQTKPPVRKLARELGVDLRTVPGSGAGGVITREDVQQAAHQGGNGTVSPERPEERPEDRRDRQLRVPVRGLRKATAAAMVTSAFTAPHVTEFFTVDVTPMMELRARLKEQPQFRDVKLTPLAFAAKALCLALRRTPEANASWDEAAGEIVYFDYVHLGIAAATPRGLVVPKIRDADQMSLRELAVALENLATTAREGRTPPGDMMNGTITITNVGVYGVDTGTPILNPGESAILALGAIRDMPWVVDGAVVARKVCQLALSFDHRVVDGQQGSQFLAELGALLANPELAITY